MARLEELSNADGTPEAEAAPQSVPEGGSTAPDVSPVVWLFPGLSLMEVQRLAPDTLRVRCPGCGATMIMTARVAAHGEFVHENDDCPVLARIEAAIARLEAVLAAGAN